MKSKTLNWLSVFCMGAGITASFMGSVNTLFFLATGTYFIGCAAIVRAIENHTVDLIEKDED